MTFEKHGSLYYDGIHWYRPCVRDGKTVLEIMSDEEAAETARREDLRYDEVSD